MTWQTKTPVLVVDVHDFRAPENALTFDDGSKPHHLLSSPPWRATSAFEHRGCLSRMLAQSAMHTTVYAGNVAWTCRIWINEITGMIFG